jgi:hypothetical protein
LLAAAIGVSASLPVHAGDQTFCRRASAEWAKWVVESRNKLKQHPGAVERLQLSIAQEQEFRSVTDKVSGRANLLLDKNLSESEVRADLYSVCMSS